MQRVIDAKTEGVRIMMAELTAQKDLNDSQRQELEQRLTIKNQQLQQLIQQKMRKNNYYKIIE